ncbi:MAG: hypothetical protein HOP11_01640 [Saprospiraceae bacterium]|nr:hypothetical protein [Saprospiraceae bacterium]
MKIILDEIEFILPEATFRTVKDSHTLGRVKKANEISKNLWNYQIKFEDKLIECEIKYGKNTVSKILCACGRSNIKHPCLHAWIASYWHFREVIPQRTTAKQNSPTQKLSDIDFGEINNQELNRFVQLSLKLNQNLIPWTRFILPIEGSIKEIFSYFQLALAHFDVQDTGSEKKQRLKQYKEHLLALEFVYEQSLLHFIQGDLEKAYGKIFSCHVKLNEWLSYYTRHNHSRLSKLQNDVYNAAEQILKSIKAPELQESLFQFHTSFLHQQHTSIAHHKNNVFNLILENVYSKSHKTNYYEILISQCQKPEFYSTNEFEAVYCLINLFDFKDFESIFKNFLATNISSQTWLILIHKIRENDSTLIFKSHLELIFSGTSSSEVRKSIATLIIESFIQSGQIDKARIEAKKYSILLLNLAFAKIYFSEKDDNSMDIYLKEFGKHHKKSHNEFLLELFYSLHENEKLINIIPEIDNVETIILFDSILFKSHWSELLEAYLLRCQLHLATHAGTQAVNYIDKIKSHIRTYGTKSQFEQFQLKVQQLFPERAQLVITK